MGLDLKYLSGRYSQFLHILNRGASSRSATNPPRVSDMPPDFNEVHHPIAPATVSRSAATVPLTAKWKGPANRRSVSVFSLKNSIERTAHGSELSESPHCFSVSSEELKFLADVPVDCS